MPASARLGLLLITLPTAAGAQHAPIGIAGPSTVRGSLLMGGVLGGLIGALIGGQFPKAEDP